MRAAVLARKTVLGVSGAPQARPERTGRNGWMLGPRCRIRLREALADA
jgi:hypothetical protein